MFNWNIPNIGIGIFILIIWETFWKTMGLWKAAKKGEKLWFLAIFLINLFGVIPIVYLWRSNQLKSAINDILEFLRLEGRLKKNHN